MPLVDSGIYRDSLKPCYVMPKADGTLEDEIREKAISIEDRLRLFDQICYGVSYLHKSSIIHRDLKPDNILMLSGTPKVSDLGLCLLVGEERTTPSSEAVGPRFYMAPELEDGRFLDVGFEADVYSLGKLLYCLLSNGKIFSREKHRNRERFLPRLFNDERLRLFYSLFDKTIVDEPSKRYPNAGELQNAFQKVFKQYLNHPLTTLQKKFETVNCVMQASKNDLRCLAPEEWGELLNEAKKSKIIIPQIVLEVACESLNNIFVRSFTEILLECEMTLDSGFVAHASKCILLVPDYDAWFQLWFDSDRFSHVALNALNQVDNEVVNAIAQFSWLTLRHCDGVIMKLAEHLSLLTQDSKNKFLAASVKVHYECKESILLALSHDENLDLTSLEAVVAGLCACNTEPTMRRVIELADQKEMDERLAAIVRGIVLGSSPETAKRLSQKKWSSGVIQVLIEAMKKVENTDSKENDSDEDDE